MEEIGKYLVDKVSELSKETGIYEIKAKNKVRIEWPDGSWSMISCADSRMLKDFNSEFFEALHKKDVEIERLKGENDGLEHILEQIEISCDKSTIPNMNIFDLVTDKVEHLRQMYLLANRDLKLADQHKAKASKLNAEKRKLLGLARGYLDGSRFDMFFNQYKAWQKEQRKEKS